MSPVQQQLALILTGLIDRFRGKLLSMHIGPFYIVAPGIKQHGFIPGAQANDAAWNEAEIVGSAVWLWMHSHRHRDKSIKELPMLLLPFIKHQQFMLVSENNKPIFYLSWANFSAEAESSYIKNLPCTDPIEDWNSGDRVWVIDWIAPFGHTKEMMSLVKRYLLSNCCVRYLYHRGNESGLRIKTFQGVGVMKQEAQHWFATHPVMLGES